MSIAVLFLAISCITLSVVVFRHNFTIAELQRQMRILQQQSKPKE
jgi:hypothetical protein